MKAERSTLMSLWWASLTWAPGDNYDDDDNDDYDYDDINDDNDDDDDDDDDGFHQGGPRGEAPVRLQDLWHWEQWLHLRHGALPGPQDDGGGQPQGTMSKPDVITKN